MTERREQGGRDEVAVDTTLELDLGAVEDSVESYLTDQSATSRQQLVTSLAGLDQQIERSDAYEGSVIGSGAVGSSTKGSIIGETSSFSAAQEIPEAELRAQMGLVKAAKDEVTAPTPETLTQLRAAREVLAALRGQAPPTT
jgi:hypothetical protein